MNASVGIVGGGFSGLLLAVTLTNAGYNVLVFEEDKRLGIPPHCTGIISLQALRMIEDITGPLPSSLIASRLSGVRVCAPQSCVDFHVREGLVRLDRLGLDEYLGARAEARGAKVMLGRRVVRVTPQGEIILGNGATYRVDYAVIAEGARPRLRAVLGLGLLESPAYGVNYIVDSKAVQELVYTSWRFPASDLALVLFDHSYAPGYAWAFNLPGGGSSVVGIASHSLEVVRRFLGNLDGFIRGGYGGRLYIGHGAPSKLRLGRVLVFGDAAGLNKPLTGGGLYPQALAASLIARCLVDTRNSEALPYCIEGATRRVLATLSPTRTLSRLLLREPETVECILKSVKPIIENAEYDRHLITAIQTLKQSLGPRLFRRCMASVSLKVLISLAKDFIGWLRLLVAR